MARTFFRKKGLTENAVMTVSKSGYEDSANGRIGAKALGRPSSQNDRSTEHSVDGVERHAVIFDDTDVCRELGLLRRVLVRERARGVRGVDWDCVDGHAGMTVGWIRRWNAKADTSRMKPVAQGDGIVTVRIVGRVTNADVVAAERVCDGTRVMVRGVGSAWYLHIGDEMDCRMIGGMLTFEQGLNRERY